MLDSAYQLRNYQYFYDDPTAIETLMTFHLVCVANLREDLDYSNQQMDRLLRVSDPADFLHAEYSLDEFSFVPELQQIMQRFKMPRDFQEFTYMHQIANHVEFDPWVTVKIIIFYFDISTQQLFGQGHYSVCGQVLCESEICEHINIYYQIKEQISDLTLENGSSLTRFSNHNLAQRNYIPLRTLRYSKFSRKVSFANKFPYTKKSNFVALLRNQEYMVNLRYNNNYYKQQVLPIPTINSRRIPFAVYYPIINDCRNVPVILRYKLFPTWNVTRWPPVRPTRIITNKIEILDLAEISVAIIPSKNELKKKKIFIQYNEVIKITQSICYKVYFTPIAKSISDFFAELSASNFKLELLKVNSGCPGPPKLYGDANSSNLVRY